MIYILKPIIPQILIEHLIAISNVLMVGWGDRVWVQLINIYLVDTLQTTKKGSITKSTMKYKQLKKPSFQYMQRMYKQL